jgi:hypothetical protein
MSDVKTKEETMLEMDAAALDAEKDLKNVDPVAIIKIATWWRNNYKKAGHKRLARILINFKV